ncbi:MAG: protein-L-isoaspartate O-methyltransferase [Inquilinus sp.]|nr:protein-L-isoaspartate O-methyltransferase [Inquilinus sp.]
MTDYAVARFNMVEGQLKPNKVTSPALLEAMLAVPRDRFVPKAIRGIAHVDEDIPLDGGRYLMEPMVLGRLIETAAVRDSDIALVVGCGTGYSAAVLARLANTVVALESDPDMAQTASETLAHLGVDNAVVVEGPLAEGYAKQAPYQVIVFDGAVAEIQPAILEQLADGGRLTAVLAPEGGMGRATLYQRIGSVVSHRPVFDAAVQLLPGCAPKPGFRF